MFDQLFDTYIPLTGITIGNVFFSALLLALAAVAVRDFAGIAKWFVRRAAGKPASTTAPASEE